MNKLLFSENIQFEHLGAPIVLQAPPDPSKEDYLQSFGKGYSKSSFNSQLPSYWYNSENRLQPNYDSARYKSQSTNSFSDPRFYHPSSFNFLNGKHKYFFCKHFKTIYWFTMIAIFVKLNISYFLELQPPPLAHTPITKVITNVNFPLPAPKNIKYRRIITAPSGYSIRVEIPSSYQAENDCKNRSYFEVSRYIYSNIHI